MVKRRRSLIALRWFEWMPKRWRTEQAIARRPNYLTSVNVGISASGHAVIHGNYALRDAYGFVRDRYDVRIVYPHNCLPVLPPYFHPRGALHPSVYLDSHHDVWLNRRDSHIESDWRLCLYVPGESGIDYRLPNALERVFEALHTFLIRERIYQKALIRERETGEPAVWPGPQRAHGYKGLWEAVRERGGMQPFEPCICGKGKLFGDCCSAIIATYENGVAA